VLMEMYGLSSYNVVIIDASITYVCRFTRDDTFQLSDLRFSQEIPLCILMRVCFDTA